MLLYSHLDIDKVVMNLLWNKQVKSGLFHKKLYFLMSAYKSKYINSIQLDDSKSIFVVPTFSYSYSEIFSGKKGLKVYSCPLAKMKNDGDPIHGVDLNEDCVQEVD